MFSRMKVSVRLSLLAGSMIALILLIGVLGISGMQSSNQAMASVYNDRVIPLKDLKRIADMYAVNIVDTAHKVRNNELDFAQGLVNVDEASQVIHSRWDAYLATALVPEEKELVNQLKPLLNDADKAVAELKTCCRPKTWPG